MKEWTVFIRILLLITIVVSIKLGIIQAENIHKGFAFNNPENYVDYPNLHGGKPQ